MTSPIHDLRSYLQVLEAAGQLLRVRQGANLVHELADVAATAARQVGKAVLFEQVAGAQVGWPIFANAVVSQALAALALGCAPAEVPQVMGRALDPGRAVPPRQGAEAVW